MHPRISIIAALSENNVIGRDNDLPWYLPSDMKRLKALTMGHPLVMGRKTYESIGRPLPGRTSIVISRNKEKLHYPPEVKKASSLDEALEIAQASEGGDTEIFLFGGGQIYAEGIERAERLYLTVVKEDVEGDTHFPDYSNFTKVIKKEEGVDGGVHLTYMILEKDL